jgi:FG-GAP-like repeat
MGSSNRNSAQCALLAAILVVGIYGCGSTLRLAISVSVSPLSASLQAGSTKTITATVANDSSNRGVTWKVSCSTSSCGSVSPTSTASGASTMYTAPTSNLPDQVTVTATSATDPTKTASAKVTVIRPPLSISIDPPSYTIFLAYGESFIATVTNDPANGGVNWTMSAPGFDCSAVDCGSFSPNHSASGDSIMYMAPSGATAFASQVALTATSATDKTVSATASITIAVPQFNVWVQPDSAFIPVKGKAHFSAGVGNDNRNAGVTWSVGGCSGDTSVCGSLANVQGFSVDYVSPAKVPPGGHVTITATAVVDTTKSASADVQISAITFSQRNFPAGSAPTAVALADFNGDGKVDIAVADYGHPSAGDDGGVSILLGNGDGSFQAAVSSRAGKNPIAIAAADFDNDGKPDLLLTLFGDRPQNGSGSVEILFGNGDGTFTRTVTFSAGTEPFPLTVGDFNGEGKPDFAVTNFNSGVYIFLGKGDGSFQQSGPIAAGDGPAAVAVGDFNGDGRMDLAVPDGHDPVTLDHGKVSILLGNGDGTFGNSQDYPIGLLPTSVALGDVNGDGKTDLVISSFFSAFGLESSLVNVLFGNGDGTFAPAKEVTTGRSTSGSVFPLSVAIADFDSDGKPDLAEVFGLGVAVMPGNGDASFQVKLMFQPGDLPFQLAVRDLDGDGKPDIVVANRDSNNITVMINMTNQ